MATDAAPAPILPAEAPAARSAPRAVGPRMPPAPGADDAVAPGIPLEAADATREGRRIMLLGVAGAVTYWGALWLAQPALGFPDQVHVVLAVVVAVNVFCAATVSWWARLAVVPVIYACLHQLLWTVHLHYLGGLQTGFFFFLNMFPVLYAAMIGTEATVFIAANFGVLAIGTLAFAEVHGWLPPGGSVGTPLTALRAASYVGIVAVALNFAALYASRYGNLLRHFAARLQGQVAQRTAALTDKARALEEKQEEMRTFVYTVTHDLTNPLSAILLTADMLLEREGEALSAGAREDLSRIVALAGGTEDMIRDLLGLFRVTSEAEASARVDVRGLVDRALGTLAPTIAQKGITVRVGPLPRLWGPPRKLGHVVDNLLGNAVKYMPEGRGLIEVLGRAEGDAVVLAVRDDGVGIPAAYHEAIFKLFRRVPPEEQGLAVPVDGSGVGLALVRRIVTGLGGTVDVASAPGVGSTFTVRLPVRGGGAGGE